MIAGLRGLQTLNQAFKAFQPLLPNLASSLLQQLLAPGKGFPELDAPLDALEGATDWPEAAASGRATPKPVRNNLKIAFWSALILLASSLLQQLTAPGKDVSEL